MYTEDQYATLLERQAMTEEDAAAHDRRTMAGRQARAQGEHFERKVDVVSKQYVALGQLVTVIKQMPPTRPRYERKRIVFEAIGPGPCDRVFVLPSGLFGIFDCKSSSGMSSFTWSKDQEHQLSELRHVHEVTAGQSPAFALVNWRERDEVRLHTIWAIEGRTVRYVDGYTVEGYDWLAMVKYIWGL